MMLRLLILGLFLPFGLAAQTTGMLLLTADKKSPPGEITNPPLQIMINCGGPLVIDELGRAAEADATNAYYNGGGTYSNGAAIGNTHSDALYQTERNSVGIGGPLVYSIPVPNGPYSWEIGFAEIFWDAVGERVFDGSIEGVDLDWGPSGADESLDIVDQVGAFNAYVKAGTSTVSDNTFTLSLSAITDLPKISYILISNTGALVAPDAISDLAAVAGDGQVTITFTRPLGAVVDLFYDDVAGVTDADTEVSDVQSGQAITGLVNDTTYYFRVRAENAAGASALSNEVSATPAGVATGLVYYVDPAGNDSNTGEIGSPLLTLAGARDKIRTATGRTINSTIVGDWNGATVFFNTGRYYFPSTTTFDSRDSGTAGDPIIYRETQGATVTWTGAVLISNGAWVLASTGDATRYAKLPDATDQSTYMLNTNGLVSTGLFPRDFDDGDQDGILRLIDDAQLQRLSRQPNGADKDYTSWYRASSFVNQQYVQIAGTTIAAWAPSGQSPYLQGPMNRTYNHVHIPFSAVTNISGTHTRFTTSGASLGASLLPVFRVVNMLEGLDTAGEYVWLPNSTLIYYLTPDGNAPADVSLNSTDVIVRLGVDEDSASACDYVRFQDITMEGTRKNVIEIFRATGVVLEGCEVRNASGQFGAVRIEDGADCGLLNTDVHDTTVGAIMLQGGDRLTLEQAGLFITGGSIYNIGLEFAETISSAVTLTTTSAGSNWTNYSSGVTISGVNFHDIMDGVIATYASNLTIENNTFDTFGICVGDSGSLSSAFSITLRNRIYRNNTFRNFTRLGDLPGSNNDYIPQSSGQRYAIYEDCTADSVIQDNYFENGDHAMQIAAGKDHIIRRNKFVNVAQGHYASPIVFSSRGSYGPGSQTHDDSRSDLAYVPVDNVFWTTNYPTLVLYRTGGSRSTNLLYAENVTLVDNMVTSGLLARFNSDALYQVRDGEQVGVNGAQLQYPVGDFGTPQAGGGTVTAASISSGSGLP